MDAVESARRTINAHDMVGLDAPVLLMVSGGSDSTALAYIAAELHEEGMLGPLTILHVNHKLRGEDADEDAAFVACLADLLQIELATVEVDVAAIAEAEGGNIEAIARRERYAVAHEVLSDMCRELGVPVSSGRIFVAHTADDRIENFYMRSIVGTGPGGFRSMLYLNGRFLGGWPYGYTGNIRRTRWDGTVVSSISRIFSIRTISITSSSAPIWPIWVV